MIQKDAFMIIKWYLEFHIFQCLRIANKSFISSRHYFIIKFHYQNIKIQYLSLATPHTISSAASNWNIAEWYPCLMKKECSQKDFIKWAIAKSINLI